MHFFAVLFFTHFFHYFYIPATGPWYAGSIWGNVFVIAVVAPLGWLWSKTKFWPIRPITHSLQHLHTKLDEHRTEMAEHRKRIDAHNEWTARLHAEMYEHHL